MKFTMTLAVSVEPTEKEAENTCNRSNEIKKKMHVTQSETFVTISQTLCGTEGGLF